MQEIEQQLAAAYLAGYRAGITAIKSRGANFSNPLPEKPWNECEYFTVKYDYQRKPMGCCLGTKEIDPCKQDQCDVIHLKRKR